MHHLAAVVTFVELESFGEALAVAEPMVRGLTSPQDALSLGRTVMRPLAALSSTHTYLLNSLDMAINSSLLLHHANRLDTIIRSLTVVCQRQMFVVTGT